MNMRFPVNITTGAFLIFLQIFNAIDLNAQAFTDVSEEMQVRFLPTGAATYTGAVVFDYNNDGWEDIYMTGGAGMDILWENQGGNFFTDVTVEAGFQITENYATVGTIAGDIDNDGDRDLFITTLIENGNLSNWAPNLLFLNNGDGTFTDISYSSNIGRDSVNSGPASFGDINNDGYLDLYVCNFMSDRPEDLLTSNGISYAGLTSAPNFLYLNNGDNTFTEIAEIYGVSDTGLALGMAFLDYNNDANMDIYVANDDTAFPGFTDYTNSLFSNNYPNLSFTDVGKSSGTDALNTSMGVAVGDYDENGYLDLYITYCGNNSLYRNNGDNTFTDVAEAIGVADPDVPVDPLMNDKKTLLYRYTPDENFIGNDVSRIEICLNNQCYEIPFVVGVKEEIIDPIPILFVDDDNEFFEYYDFANLDLEVIDFGFTEVIMNESTLICMEIPDSLDFTPFYEMQHGTEEVTIDEYILPSSGWGANFMDFDNDTDLDLFIANGHETLEGVKGDNPNSLYRNMGNGFFENYSEQAGVMNPWSARASVLTDYDNDGDEDIFVVNLEYAEGYGIGQDPGSLLYRNNLVLDGFNNWLKVKLEGTESNRDGIGAMVKAHVGFRTLIRQIDGGSSAMAHNSIIAHFGLRAYSKVDSLEIIWPGGCTQMIYNINVNQQIDVTQDCSGLPTALEDHVTSISRLNAYPVPASDQISFLLDIQESSKVRIDLFNNEGKHILKAYEGLMDPQQPINIDLKNFPSGTYVYVVQSKLGLFSEKFVVTKK